MNRYLLKAHVYIHVQHLHKVEALKEKAIDFAKDRSIYIVSFSSSDVVSLIRLLSTKEIDTLLINNDSLVTSEIRTLLQYCKRNEIAIIHFER